jgi:hypothetical protein
VRAGLYVVGRSRGLTMFWYLAFNQYEDVLILFIGVLCVREWVVVWSEGLFIVRKKGLRCEEGLAVCPLEEMWFGE